MAFHARLGASLDRFFMALDAGQPAGPVRSGLHFFVSDVSVAIDAHKFRFFNVNLMSDLHVVGFFYLLLSDMFVATKTVIVDLLIGEKISWKQLTDFRMAIHTSDTFWMDLRGRPHGNAGLSGMA
jgi:hypothetical protein